MVPRARAEINTAENRRMPFCSSFVPRAIAANVELDVICLNRAGVIAGSFTKLNTAYGPLNREGPKALLLLLSRIRKLPLRGSLILLKGFLQNCDSETKNLFIRGSAETTFCEYSFSAGKTGRHLNFLCSKCYPERLGILRNCC